MVGAIVEYLLNLVSEVRLIPVGTGANEILVSLIRALLGRSPTVWGKYVPF